MLVRAGLRRADARGMLLRAGRSLRAVLGRVEWAGWCARWARGWALCVFIFCCAQRVALDFFGGGLSDAFAGRCCGSQDAGVFVAMGTLAVALSNGAAMGAQVAEK